MPSPVAHKAAVEKFPLQVAIPRAPIVVEGENIDVDDNGISGLDLEGIAVSEAEQKELEEGEQSLAALAQQATKEAFGATQAQ
eukprot:8526974-Pyramimonas_sp.AAC.1